MSRRVVRDERNGKIRYRTYSYNGNREVVCSVESVPDCVDMDKLHTYINTYFPMWFARIMEVCK